MRGCLDGQRLSTSRVSLTSSGALTHCLHLNFNFNTLSQPACATTSVRHTFTTQPSVHLFSPQLNLDHSLQITFGERNKEQGEEK